jgi:hypothetical protein
MTGQTAKLTSPAASSAQALASSPLDATGLRWPPPGRGGRQTKKGPRPDAASQTRPRYPFTGQRRLRPQSVTVKRISQNSPVCKRQISFGHRRPLESWRSPVHRSRRPNLTCRGSHPSPETSAAVAMLPAKGNKQNDLRLKATWLAQLAKMVCATRQNDVRSWQNGLRAIL